MRKCIFFLGFFLSATLLFSYELTLVSTGEANYIAQNWVTYVNKIPLEGKLDEYQIKFIEQVNYNENLICEIYHLYPRGHILVLSYRELIPIKSFSVVSDFDSESKGYEYAVLEELKAVFKFLQSYRQGESERIERAIKRNWNQWNKFLQMKLERTSIERLEVTTKERIIGISKFNLKDKDGIQMESSSAPPLLKTKWRQSSPYWNECPFYNGNRCLVGCVATAMTQIMRYYKWPKKGEGSYSYYWEEGDKWLNAYFSDSYDWDYMPNETWEYDTDREKDAVAELCYEAGVSIDMEYSTEGSSASPSYVANALKTYFKYLDAVKVVYRKDYNIGDEWFEVLKGQRDLSRPLEFAMYIENSGHAVVIDGYLVSDELKQVHINMGWGGHKDAYYTLDNILDYTETYLQHAVIDIFPKWAEIQLTKTSLSFSGVEGQSNPPSQSFKVRNSGEGELSYQISTPKNWISISPKSGSSAGEWDTITVSIDISNLLEGTHSDTIDITSEDADNSPQKITVNLTVQPPPIYAPLNFSGTKVKNRSLLQKEYINVLTWQANPQNRHIEKYRIYQVEGKSQSLLIELNANTFEYWHRKVNKNNQYNYTLVAVDYKYREGSASTLIVK